MAIGLAATLVVGASGFPLLSIVPPSISGPNSFTLLAIPFFLFAGHVMEYGGISRQISRRTEAQGGQGGEAQIHVDRGCVVLPRRAAGRGSPSAAAACYVCLNASIDRKGVVASMLELARTLVGGGPMMTHKLPRVSAQAITTSDSRWD